MEASSYILPGANLGMLIAIYHQLTKMNGRLGKLETRVDDHEEHDDERHKDTTDEITRTRNSVHDVRGILTTYITRNAYRGNNPRGSSD